ncbi:MAG TPA: VOC family protein [Ilumatobacteraceae bacterium]|nr:VOC family protein [Ilumatobacteraceae bacterium]
MAFHHVALATRDTAATYRFYTEVMGFELVKVVVAPNPSEDGGWAKHFFFATNPSVSRDEGLMAFWELHDEQIGTEYNVNLNSAIGLPTWVNHIAFDAASMDALHEHRDRWRSNGITVAEVDHGFCVSIYTTDPNRNMVEYCYTSRPFTDAERERAMQVLLDPSPAFDEERAKVTIWKPLVPVA